MNIFQGRRFAVVEELNSSTPILIHSQSCFLVVSGSGAVSAGQLQRLDLNILHLSYHLSRIFSCGKQFLRVHESSGDHL